MENNMEVYAKIITKVNVDPIQVLEKLIEEEVGIAGWVFKDEDKFYRGFEVGGRSHSWDEKEEIGEKQFLYVEALKLVKTTLEERVKNNH